MHGRTVVLVSHHVQLCAPGAKYVVALDNGRLQFEGTSEAFLASPVLKSLLQSTDATSRTDEEEKAELEKVENEVLKTSEKNGESGSDTSSTIVPIPSEIKTERKAPRKLVEEETRAVGRISRDIWETYIRACGNGWYWTFFIFVLIAASISPVVENGWLRCVLQLEHCLSNLIRLSGTGLRQLQKTGLKAQHTTSQFTLLSLLRVW